MNTRHQAGSGRSPSRDGAGLRRGAQVGLALTVAGSALALGGAHVHVVLVATLAVSICGTLALLGGALRRVPPPAVVLASLAAYCLLQSSPLPLSWLDHLSPRAADAWRGSLHPFGVTLSVGSLSLDPGASSVEAAKWSAYAVAFSIAAAFARRRAAALVFAVVFGSAVLVAVATAAHAALGATRVFGIYTAQLAQPGWRIGPFLNANCLAGYLVLGVLCGVGLIMAGISPILRRLAILGIALMAALVAVSGSRGGFAALALGVFVFGAFLAKTWRRQRTRSLSWQAWAGFGVALVVVPTVAVLAVPDAWELLVQSDTEKVEMWAWVVPLLRDFPLFGVGRGAFESVFPAYKPVSNDLVYSHPENFIAQWLAEWGGGVSVVGFALLVWHLRPSRLDLNRNMSALAAVIGVAAVVLQNLVDLGLELFATMLAVSVILGACWGRGPGALRAPTTSSRSDTWAGVVLIALTFMSVVLAYQRGRWPDSLERLELQEKYGSLPRKADERSAQSLWTSLRAAMSRHPADPYFPRLGALLALRVGKNALPWIDRALERCAIDSRTHWILANVLIQHGRLSQALLEARLTAEYDPVLATTVGSAVAGWTQQLDELERAAPPGHAGSVVLYQAATRLPEQKYASLREELLRSAIHREPTSAPLRRVLAGELLAAFNSERCAAGARSRCESSILSEAAALDRLKPESADGSEVRARLYGLTGALETADRALNARCPQLEQAEQTRCWLALLSVVPPQASNRRLVDRVARRLVKNACDMEEGCEAALVQAGDKLAQLGEWFDALAYFERAVSRAPTAAGFLKVADAASALGRSALAQRALIRAASHALGNAELSGQIQARQHALTK